MVTGQEGRKICIQTIWRPGERWALLCYSCPGPAKGVASTQPN